MNLKIQIISMAFSLFYGIFLGFFVNLNYRFLFLGSRKKRIFSNFLFFTFAGILYFIILKKINNAILHYYFLLLFLMGFSLYFYIKEKKKNK